MPFFEGAKNVNAAHSVFNDIAGDQWNSTPPQEAYQGHGGDEINVFSEVASPTALKAATDEASFSDSGSQGPSPPIQTSPSPPPPPSQPSQNANWGSGGVNGYYQGFSNNQGSHPPNGFSHGPQFPSAQGPAQTPHPPPSQQAHSWSHQAQPSQPANSWSQPSEQTQQGNSWSHQAQPSQPANSWSHPAAPHNNHASGNTSPATSDTSSSFAHTMAHAKPPRRGSSGDSSNLSENVLGIASFVLTALQDAAQFAPIPLLGQAAGLALGIASNAQAAGSNKEAFGDLATDACALVYSVVVIFKEQSNEGRTITEDLTSNLQSLVETLIGVEKFALKHTQRNIIKRMVLSSKDRGDIDKYRGRMRTALDMFWLQTSIHVRTNLTRIAEQQGVMFEAIQSNNNNNNSNNNNNNNTRDRSRSRSRMSQADKLAMFAGINYLNYPSNGGGNQYNIWEHRG